MSRRIDIELTSSLDDGTWTWRAAGAKKPRGVLPASILPDGAKVGDELKVEVEQEIDGITVLHVVHGRDKHDPKGLLELLPIEREFQPVVETRARRDRGDRPRRDDGPRRDRPPRGDRGDRPDRDRGDRPRDGQGRGDGGRGDGRGRGEGRGGDGARNEGRSAGGRGSRERRGPSFTPPPEVPQRPKPKRLRPGKAHRSAVLAELPAEQRPIAELALQGIGAVRQRLKEENQRAVAEGRAAMPEASVMKIAEELLPLLRVAEWRDRADAAKAQADDLDLRDLRSVVAASDDPIVARDETTRVLAEELKVLLVHKQEQELSMWFGDIDAALAVGRVIRALRLSSQPPKAGVPFPTDIAQRLADSANASLAPMDAPERWGAMLEAAAFSPIRSLIKPQRKPDVVNDELMATLKRLAPALPHVAELFEIEVDPKAPMPKPMRPTGRPTKGKPGDAKAGGGDQAKRGDRPPRGPKPERAPKPDAAAGAPSAAVVEDDADASPASEPAAETAEPTTATGETVTTDAIEPTVATDEPTSPDAPSEPATDEPTATEATSEPTADVTEPTAATDEPTATDAPAAGEPVDADDAGASDDPA